MITTNISRVGGKFRLRKELLNLTPDHDFFLSMFLGSGIYEINKTRCKVEIFNDIDSELRKIDVLYAYGCPYCNFTSEFFNGVDLHIAYSKKCYRYSQIQPCYPINYCIHIPTGRQILT